MRVRYTIPFKTKVIIDDHWEVPMQGGKLRVVEEEGYANALELVFERQPLEYAPRIQNHAEGKIAMTITKRDLRIGFVKYQFDNVAAFLKCTYDVELMTEDIETKYEEENPDEEQQIKVKSFGNGRREIPFPLPFDVLTRAVMAAENKDGPRFEATLVATARSALAQQEFINSFRYSFLLMESLYGEGQFKKAGLQGAFKRNQEFLDIVEFAIKELIPAKNDRSSDTAKLLAENPNAAAVIDHLVERRGFYFHGNIKRKDAWKANEQGSAESLALLAIGIASQIAIKAAGLLFSPEYERRHFEDAMHAGAEIVFQVNFKFRDPGENFDRERQIEIAMPGTKPTPRTAFDVAQQCLKIFQHTQPASALLSMECTMIGTGQKVFELVFSVCDDLRGAG